MMIRVACVALAALFVIAGVAHAQTINPNTPLLPGGARITTRAPDPDKWERLRSASETEQVYRCRALACPDPQTVLFSFSRSPTRTIDPKALDRFAKSNLPRIVRSANAAREINVDGTETFETLMSEAGSLKGYPAALNASKVTRGDAPAFLQTAMIFAGPLMVRVMSVALDRTRAGDALAQFVEAMQIVEGPAPRTRQPPGVQNL